MNIDANSDYHMHTVFSDGVARIDEMVSAAMRKGLGAITITDHMPLPFDNRYAMHPGDMERYRREIEVARKKYAGQISLQAGLEFEYLQPFANWVQSIADLEWDHRTVSVHCLLIDHRACLVNGSENEFKTFVERCGYDMEKACRTYYGAVQAAVRTGLFDIAGHLDVIKKHNSDERYFSERSPWYRSLVIETLETIKQKSMKMEVNTAGLTHPVGQPYPSRWIIREAMERDIPVVLGSDAHKPEALGQYFSTIDQWVGVEQLSH